MGGWSLERPISLKSGEAVFQSLKRQGIPCFKYDVTTTNLVDLWSKKFERAFIVLHGQGGEDGFIQQQLEQRNISYTGSDVIASQRTMDKMATKKCWQHDNIPTPPSMVFNTMKKLPDFPLPWVVKPTLEGSSLGVHKINALSQLKTAIADTQKFSGDVMIEQWIEGAEYTVGIVGEQALPIVKIEVGDVFYDYKAKYLATDTSQICPCGLNHAMSMHIQSLALKAFHSVGAKSWGRVDLMLSKNNEPFLLEINTVPGMTSHSLLPTAAAAAGMDFNQLVYRILNHHSE